MRNIFYFAMVLGFLLFGFVALASGGNETRVIADIYVPGGGIGTVSLQVPDIIDLGNATLGEEQQDPISADKIYINNTGNVKVTVTPKLKNNNEVFNYIYFSTAMSGPYKKIGNFSINITKPSGSPTNAGFYVKLDLTNYTGNLTENMIRYNTTIIFEAVAS